ncbi:MAG: hypothetical protein ACRDF8_00765 [Chloroflexota bacterium]
MANLTPNGATAASLAGGYLATVATEILSQYHLLTVTPQLATALTGLFCIGLTYLHPDGRRPTPAAAPK